MADMRIVRRAVCAATLTAAGALCSCAGEGNWGQGAGGGAGASGGAGPGAAAAGDLKAGDLPAWWIAEPRAVGSLVTVSSSGIAPDASVARDLAIRNARAAGRAVLGVEPVRVVVTREASTRSRSGEYEAFILARCDGAGAAALGTGVPGTPATPPARPDNVARAAREVDKSGAVAPAGAPAASDVKSAPAQPTPPAASATAPAPAPSPAATPAAAPEAAAAPAHPSGAPAPAGTGAPGAPVAAPSDAPTWWFDDIRRDGTAARACASADGTGLVETRRVAVEAVKAKLKAKGVAGSVQTLFIATRKPDAGGYRVYVMGQGEVK